MYLLNIMDKTFNIDSSFIILLSQQQTYKQLSVGIEHFNVKE